LFFSYLSSLLLADKATGLLLCCAIGLEAQAFDVCVRRGTIVAVVTLDLADLHHLRDGKSVSRQ
jgi:hypothetical protein